MGWDAYDRTRLYQPMTFCAELVKFEGWLAAAQTMHPTDAWIMRQSMELACPTSDIGRQLLRIAGLRHRHTGSGQSSHPNYTDWQLDQDRRCNDGHWPDAELY